MPKKPLALLPRAGAALLLAGLSGQASPAAPGACTREIVVASSPVGRAMLVEPDNTVSGAVKDFLDQVGSRSGCLFRYLPLPRARAWTMVQAGRADIVPAASQSAERDLHAQFVATHQVRPLLVSLGGLPAIGSAAALQRAQLHVAVVRGYDFGAAYHKLLAELARQGLLHEVTDPQALARLLLAGQVQAAVLPPTAFADAGESHQLSGRLQLQVLSDLPWVRVGFYLSRSTLGAHDRAALQAAFTQAIDNGVYAAAMRRHYPAWAMRDVSLDTGRLRSD